MKKNLKADNTKINKCWYVRHKTGVYGPYSTEEDAKRVSELLYPSDRKWKAVFEVEMKADISNELARGLLDEFFKKVKLEAENKTT